MSTQSTPILPVVTTVNAENPWPGLLSFREGDAGYFHGRRAETEDLLRLVVRERLVVLFGLSGLGKSSLLQAGLFPRLRTENIFPIYLRLDCSTEKPDFVAQVFSTVAREAPVREIEAPAPKPGETLWEYFHRDGNAFWNARNRPVVPLLVLDQFEELFTLGHLGAIRTNATESFLEQLADLTEGRPPARLRAWIDDHPDQAGAFNFGRHYYKVLLSIREDFLPDLETLRSRMPMVALTRMRLGRMNGEAALRVVNQAEHLIDADVAEQVVRFVAACKDNTPLSDLEIEPALLSVICRELNNRRQALKEPKISSSLLRGNQEQVIADFYERSMADLAPEVRSFLEEHMLTVSGYRDSVAMENALSTPGVTRKAIDTLVERRLIRREDRGGVQRLELTHDLLAGVVRASRDSRRHGEAAEQERAALLDAQEEERKALLKAQEEERSRRSRIAAIVFLALLLIALGALGWALLAQRKALVEEAKAKDSEQTVIAKLKEIEAQQKQIAINRTAIDYVTQQAAGPRPDIVLYRQPTTDQVLPALRELGFKDIQIRPQQANANIQEVPVDTLVYGGCVTNEDIRTIAVALSGAGLPIRRIIKAEKQPSPHLVQLIASAKTKALNLTPLTLDQIKAWSRPDKVCAP